MEEIINRTMEQPELVFTTWTEGFPQPLGVFNAAGDAIYTRTRFQVTTERGGQNGRLHYHILMTVHHNVDQLRLDYGVFQRNIREEMRRVTGREVNPQVDLVFLRTQGDAQAVYDYMSKTLDDLTAVQLQAISTLPNLDDDQPALFDEIAEMEEIGEEQEIEFTTIDDLNLGL